jgi:hypothetical protein
LRKADAANKDLEERVGADRVKPKIGLEEVRDIRGFFREPLLQEFEC